MVFASLIVLAGALGTGLDGDGWFASLVCFILLVLGSIDRGWMDGR